jgi:SAM-dependent methyltransferase
MKLEEIKKHWENWAEEYGKSLRATTKTSTAKQLELDAFKRYFKSIGAEKRALNVLEVGCGNGYNCLELASTFNQCHFTGIDYIPLMVENANALKAEYRSSNTIFLQDDILKLNKNEDLKNFDVVFTDRCLINLNNIELQLQALDQLTDKLKVGGHLLLIENIKELHAQQNNLREWVGLKSRRAAEYNCFIEEKVFLNHANKRLKLLDTEDFMSFHDIILYVLVPLLGDGKHDYSHPAMKAATEIAIQMNHHQKNNFGSFGQNRLYIFERNK